MEEKIRAAVAHYEALLREQLRRQEAMEQECLPLSCKAIETHNTLYHNMA